MIESKDDFSTTMLSLMDEVNAVNPDDSKDLVFNDKVREYIHEMAAYARNNKWYKKITEKETWANEQKSYVEAAMKQSASKVYFDMLLKIVEAPTFIHAELAPMFLIPVIDDMLSGYKTHEKDMEDETNGSQNNL